MLRDLHTISKSNNLRPILITNMEKEKEKTETSSRRSSRVSNPAKLIQKEPRKWTLQEKKELYAGLKRHGINKMQLIQAEYLPNRTVSEIEHLLSSLRSKGKRNIASTAPLQPAKKNLTPIEVWLSQAELLTRQEVDYSFLLSEIFSIFGNLEPHDAPPSDKSPDFRTIYDYFSKLLKNETLPKLKNIECDVIVDILESLEAEIKTLDTRSQERLLRLKHQLLTAPALLENRRLQRERIRQALDDAPGPSQSAQAMPSTLHQPQPAGHATPSNLHQSHPSNFATPSNINQSHPSNPATPSSLLQSPLTPLRLPSRLDPFKTPEVPPLRAASQGSEGLSNTSSVSDRPSSTSLVSEIPLSANSNSERPSSGSQASERQPNASTGPVSQPNASEASERSSTASPASERPSSSSQSSERTPSASQPTERPTNSSQAAQQPPGARSGAPPDSRPQKTPLYTLNPLCIPVTHLPLKRLPPQQ